MAGTASSASTTKLTDAQLVLLSTASQRDDSLVVLTDAHPSVAQTIAALLCQSALNFDPLSASNVDPLKLAARC